MLPKLNGKLTGISLRVPVGTGSVTDLVAVMGKTVTVEEVNAAIKEAAEGPSRGSWFTTPTRSSRATSSATRRRASLDASWTQVIGGNLLKVLSWYDNEFGYSNRTADLIAKIAKL